ncbi:MAG: hypothetical protein HYX41_05915 [Bdellovibrio sp.]|nr:hypothetical protein [Bdellovibrio sp.]
MGSGASRLGPDIVRGQANHGLVALVLRWLDPLAKKPHLDTQIFLVLVLVLGTLWTRLSKRLEIPVRWAGWLALGVVVHPLAWHHSFVLTYPLATYSLHFALAEKKQRKFYLALSLIGFALIGLIIPNTIGSWVRLFELASSKSLGVLICAWVVLRCGRKVQGRLA